MDLGPHHRLICNHYTLRHDASADFLRSWVLQVGPSHGGAWAGAGPGRGLGASGCVGCSEPELFAGACLPQQWVPAT
jgi:hypothetical protein